jgi:hypothetical protein
MYICIHLIISIMYNTHIHIHTHTYTHTQTYTHTHIHTHTGMGAVQDSPVEASEASNRVVE